MPRERYSGTSGPQRGSRTNSGSERPYVQPVFTEPFSLSDHEILEQGRQKTRDDAHRAELRVCGTVEANPYMALKPADRLPSFESQRVLGPSIIAHAGSSKGDVIKDAVPSRAPEEFHDEDVMAFAQMGRSFDDTSTPHQACSCSIEVSEGMDALTMDCLDLCPLHPTGMVKGAAQAEKNRSCGCKMIQHR